MDTVNESDLEWSETEHGSTHFRRKKLAAEANADQLGCSLYELPAGNSAWPYHYHTANEEAFYVLAGEGTLRGPDGDQPLGAGDFVACPAGEDGGHRVVNDSDEPLRYLAMSTMTSPDASIYPDSGKVGVFLGAPPGGNGERLTGSGFYRLSDGVDYWDGEE